MCFRSIPVLQIVVTSLSIKSEEYLCHNSIWHTLIHNVRIDDASTQTVTLPSPFQVAMFTLCRAPKGDSAKRFNTLNPMAHFFDP